MPGTMLTSALRLFLLQRVGFEDLAFPRWHAAAAHGLLLMAFVLGIAGSRAAMERALAPDLWHRVAVVTALFLLMGTLGWLLLVAFLRIWLRASRRWDGHGKLFNLLASAVWLPWLLIVLVWTCLGPWGVVQQGGTLALLLYSAWVAVQAMTCAMPRLGPVYTALGLCLGSLLALAGAATVFTLAIGLGFSSG